MRRPWGYKTDDFLRKQRTCHKKVKILFSFVTISQSPKWCLYNSGFVQIKVHKFTLYDDITRKYSFRFMKLNLERLYKHIRGLLTDWLTDWLCEWMSPLLKPTCVSNSHSRTEGGVSEKRRGRRSSGDFISTSKNQDVFAWEDYLAELRIVV